MLQPRELVREGKSKRVYATEDPDLAILYFKDETAAFNGLKRGRIIGKGEVNNAVCRKIFTLLAENGVENHYLEQLDARQSVVRRCEMIPMQVKVRDRVAGHLMQRVDLPIGTELKEPVIEFVLKNEELEYPMLNYTHIRALGLATQEEMDAITATALRVNEVLKTFTREIGVELVNFKLEFGRYKGRILLADEISPDTARLWDSNTHEPMDIDRFKEDLGNAEQAYQELLNRMMGNK